MSEELEAYRDQLLRELADVERAITQATAEDEVARLTNELAEASEANSKLELELEDLRANRTLARVELGQLKHEVEGVRSYVQSLEEKQKAR